MSDLDEDIEVDIPPNRDATWWADLVAKYTADIDKDELRRFICLEVAAEAMANPDKLAEVASKYERFLKGKTLSAVEDK